MNNQKDNNTNTIKNKAISLKSKVKPINYFNVFDHDVYINLAERSSKIVTALYMVTDFLDDNDPLRNIVRESITEIMQKLFILNHAHKIDRVEMLSEVHNMIYATISYLDIVYKNGFVSNMNHTIIAGEMRNLQESIDTQIKKSLPYDKKANNTTSIENFSFSDEFFGEEIPQQVYIKDTLKRSLDVKDTEKKEDTFKKTIVEKGELPTKTMTAVKGQMSEKPLTKKPKRAPKVNEAKEERKDNILKILKQKPHASINDICSLFKDCSSKTIQRDLNELISGGLVSKEGSRRWSKYNLTY